MRNISSVDVLPEQDHIVVRAGTTEIAGTSRDQGSGRCRHGEIEDVEPVNELARILGPRRSHQNWLLEEMNQREVAQVTDEERGDLLGERKPSHREPLSTVDRVTTAGHARRYQDDETSQDRPPHHRPP